MKSRFIQGLDSLRNEGLGPTIRKIGHLIRERIAADNPTEHQIILKAFGPVDRTKWMIDVGAATGNTLAPFADRNWTIYAFEPDARNRARLERVFGSYPNVIVDDRALSNQVLGEAVFYQSNQSIGISSLVPFDPTHQPSGVVAVTTLKEFIQEVGIPRIDFLKVDTEGYDLLVLQGAPWSDEIRPEVIMTEFDDEKTKSVGYGWKDLAEFLVDHGYQVLVSEWKPLAQYGTGHAWRGLERYPCGLRDPNGWGNLIASVDRDLLSRIELGFRRFGSHSGRR